MGQEVLGDILFETRGQITILTINRPEQRNSINKGVREGLFAGFERFEADKTSRVAILTGAGTQAFCAGADLKEMSELGIGILPRNFLPLIGDTIEVRKPVIAAVNGVAYAGGWMLAQMCDLVVASDSARFAITEAKVGRGMPWATPLTHMIPQKILLEILMTGNPVTAQRAYEFGFVNHVTRPEDLLARALELAETICDNAPLTVAAAKQMVYTATEMGRSAAMEAGRWIFEPVYQSQDAQEGPKAFAEKRKPNWRGQ